MRNHLAALLFVLCLGVAFSATVAAPRGTPLAPRSLSFVQDGMHNCGTVAMLLSWANSHSDQAAKLVRRQTGGSYLVAFAGAKPIRVTPSDLTAATKARVVRTARGDEWAKIVVTAFVKAKCEPGKLDCKATDWLYAGEIAALLTGGGCEVFEIKPEALDKNKRIQVGDPIPLAAVKKKLGKLRGRPMVAYTNRRIHIWAVLDYDPRRSRVRVRNPRRDASEWLSVEEFRRRFQLVVYANS